MGKIVTVTITKPISSQYLFNGWRGKYTSEGGNYNPVGMPAVIPSDMQDGFDFTKEMQIFSYQLMTAFNSYITPNRWRAIFNYDIAFTNENGFDKPGDPRADWVNNTNTDKPLPKLMKRIVCSGSFNRASQVGDRLWMSPGTGGIDIGKPLPTIQTVINNNWFFYATNNTPTPSHFAQGWDGADYHGPVLIPFFLDKPVSYSIEQFQRWQDNVLPDPLKLYL